MTRLPSLFKLFISLTASIVVASSAYSQTPASTPAVSQADLDTLHSDFAAQKEKLEQIQARVDALVNQLRALSVGNISNVYPLDVLTTSRHVAALFQANNFGHIRAELRSLNGTVVESLPSSGIRVAEPEHTHRVEFDLPSAGQFELWVVALDPSSNDLTGTWAGPRGSHAYDNLAVTPKPDRTAPAIHILPQDTINPSDSNINVKLTIDQSAAFELKCYYYSTSGRQDCPNNPFAKVQTDKLQRPAKVDTLGTKEIFWDNLPENTGFFISATAYNEFGLTGNSGTEVQYKTVAKQNFGFADAVDIQMTPQEMKVSWSATLPPTTRTITILYAEGDTLLPVVKDDLTKTKFLATLPLGDLNNKVAMWQQNHKGGPPLPPPPVIVISMKGTAHGRDQSAEAKFTVSFSPGGGKATTMKSLAQAAARVFKNKNVINALLPIVALIK